MDDLEAAHKAVEEAQKAVAQAPGGGGTPDFWNTHYVLTLSLGLFLFAVFIFACATYLLHKGRTAWTLLRLFGVLSIIFLSVFVLIVGYTDKQLLPVMGLFGSIVGYLLGKTTAADKGQTGTETSVTPKSGSDDQDSSNGGAKSGAAIDQPAKSGSEGVSTGGGVNASGQLSSADQGDAAAAKQDTSPISTQKSSQERPPT